jgi:hypothetical protein
MPNRILHKRKNQAGSVPAAGDLLPGELAINTADGKVFTKKEDGTIVALANKEHTHSGSDITSGTVPVARLGTGTASSDTYLRGDGTWQKIQSWQLDGQDADYTYETGNVIILDEGEATNTYP